MEADFGYLDSIPEEDLHYQPGMRVKFSMDTISLTCESTPSTSWSYTDKAGHGHRYSEELMEGSHYHTLRSVTDETCYCHDDYDGHELTHQECAQCGEVIQPGVTSGVMRVPGRESITLDWTRRIGNGTIVYPVRNISRTTAVRLFAEARSA